jgi:hypothetical protein
VKVEKAHCIFSGARHKKVFFSIKIYIVVDIYQQPIKNGYALVVLYFKHFLVIILYNHVLGFDHSTLGIFYNAWESIWGGSDGLKDTPMQVHLVF